jgi:hypothetical protein
MRKLNSGQIKDLSTLVIPSKGIVYNTTTGSLTSKVSTENFNTYIDGYTGFFVTANSDPALSLSGASSNRHIIRSIHVTNISNAKAYLLGSVRYANGNTASLANLIPFPVGESAEFISRPMILKPGDTIYLQGFDNTFTRANGLLNATFTYETVTDDASFAGVGTTLANSNTNVNVTGLQSVGAVVESIRVVNVLAETVTVKAFIANSTVIPKSYYTFNLGIPQNTSVELLQAPKVVGVGDNIYVNYVSQFGASNGVSVFVAYRQSDYATTLASPTTAEVGNTQYYVSFTTSQPDGTVLYYSIEES